MEFSMAENHETEDRTEDAAFIERIAASLRAPERAHPSFEKRLMERVRREGLALYPGRGSSQPSWWRKQRVVRFSPIAAMAMAAGVTAVIALSGVAIGSRIGARTNEVARATRAVLPSDTVHLVRFVFVDSRASSVELVGDFNEWTRGSTTLSLSGVPGVWAVSVPLAPGRHEYAFIVNGTRWVADPLAVRATDDFGTESSVIRVATPRKSET
jgi:Glycogen recognition site of AMP-activated protein kinase